MGMDAVKLWDEQEIAIKVVHTTTKLYDESNEVIWRVCVQNWNLGVNIDTHIFGDFQMCIIEDILK